MLIRECRALRIPLSADTNWTPEYLELTAEHYVRQWLAGEEPPHVGTEALLAFAKTLGIEPEDVDQSKILPMVPVNKQVVPGAAEKRAVLEDRRKITMKEAAEAAASSAAADRAYMMKGSRGSAIKINSGDLSPRPIEGIALLDTYRIQTTLSKKRGLGISHFVYEILETSPPGMAMHYRDLANILIKNGHKKPTTPAKNYQGSVCTAILRMAEVQRGAGGWVWLK